VIDNFLLADGLHGNSRLKLFRALISPAVGNQDVLAIAGALRQNKGLVDLDLSCARIGVAWGAICDSLKTHPTLEVLNLRTTGRMAPLAPEVLKSRMQALLDVAKLNTSIHELFLGSVIPEVGGLGGQCGHSPISVSVHVYYVLGFWIRHVQFVSLVNSETFSELLAHILNFRDYTHHATPDAGLHASQHEIVAMHEMIWFSFTCTPSITLAVDTLVSCDVTAYLRYIVVTMRSYVTDLIV
jgi:hypothetical protein